MGRNSAKGKAFHDAYLREKYLASQLAVVGEGEEQILPGQPRLYVAGQPSDLVTLRDGTTYATDRNGSLRRAPAGRKVMGSF